VAHICAPEKPEWRAAATRLADAIEKRTGGRPKIVKGAWEPLRSDETTIAIGHLGNNFIIERLWIQRYQEVNVVKPGAGAYIVQTIPEPYDAPKGKNVLLVGASDASGAMKGVDRLIELLEGKGKDLSLDRWVLEVSNAKRMSRMKRTQLLKSKLTKFWLRDFHSAVQQYRNTGDEAWAERARFVLRKINERYLKFGHDPNVLKYWPEPTGTATHRIYWPEETSADRLGTMWDFFEEAPILTADDRWRGANSMLNALHDFPRHVSHYKTFAKQETTWPVIFNHSTFPLIGMYYLARHFQRFYPEVDKPRIDDYMNRCANGFNTQAKSWKPSEDATGYLSIVPRHTILYTLGEGDYSYFTSGRAKMLADYTVGFCDNTGDSGSFGDNGYGRTNYTRGLDWALWYYRDANILWWLNRTSSKGYRNPFHADLKPEPWTDLPGIRAFPLTASIYDWTTRFTAYGPSVMPPNAPIEKCFDKIAYRENLDKKGQYLLLDGYSRGGHLHYDGNAIIKFYADGEDWLIDGDYLVRNTTDHSMLSVVRDGRCNEIEPPCASLDHMADTPKVGITRTSVRGYNGADWSRDIFWSKGGPICLIDRAVAVTPGAYKFESIFKMIDVGKRGGDGQRTFSLTRTPPPTQGLAVVKNPAEGIAAAVRFDGTKSRLNCTMTIPKGEYWARVICMGKDSRTDSFWLKIDDDSPVAIHTPLGVFGRPYDSGRNPKAGDMPRVRIARDGEHLIEVTLRDKPGQFIDKIEFVATKDDKVVASVEAEDLLGKGDTVVAPAPAKSFHLRSDGFSRLVQSTRINHKRMDIRYAHHKFGGQLAKGEALTNMALFYSTDAQRQDDWDIQRVSDDLALLTASGKPWAIVGNGTADADPGSDLRSDAAMIWHGTDSLVWADTRKVGKWVEASGIVDVSVDLAKGVCVLSGESKTLATVDKQKVVLADGRAQIRLGRERVAALRAAAKAALATAATKARFGTGGKPAGGEGNALEPVWAVAPHKGTAQPAIEMATANVDGKPGHEILAIRGRYLTCIDATGKVLWEFDGTDELYAVCGYDIDGDGADEVFCGGKSKTTYVLETDGSLLSRHPIETYWRVSRTTIHEPRMDDILVRDFDGDGDWEAAIGSVDGFVQMVDHRFKQLWIEGEVNHGTTELEAVDVDGDGKLELAVGNRYGKLFILRADGKRLSRSTSELGDVQMTVADLDRDGTFELVNGSATGAFKVGKIGSRGALWEFPNYGYPWRDIRAADMVGDAFLEVIAASDTGYVYLIDAAGKTLAQADLGSAVLSLAVYEDQGAKHIAAGLQDGSVVILDASLKEVARARMDSRINWVSVVAKDGRPTVVAATEAGRIVAIAP
ncbi:VCBS repeat-containing protein, partial [Candidatus Poribacteria bacterium]|nr:VCBS repeat-containing protein [Candidatus Poribacteria bacterium]